MSEGNKDYMIFSETGVTKIDQKIFPLDYLYQELKRCSQILDNLAPSNLGILVPLVITNSEFSVAIGLKPNNQGSILDVGGIEESARKELIEKIKEAEAKSIQSIKSGNKIARKLTNKNMNIEELSQELENGTDENITRKAIHYGRLQNMNIDFPRASQKVGGNLKIPTHLNSSQKLKFTQCVVNENIGGGEFEIYTPDLYKVNDSSMIKKRALKVFCDTTSLNFTLMQLAYLFHASFEFDAVITEQIKDKKRILLVTKIESESIIKNAEQNISELKENLSFNF